MPWRKVPKADLYQTRLNFPSAMWGGYAGYPQQMMPGMTPMARSFYGENKRVRNNRIKDELGVELLYPSYREGLQAVLKAEDMEQFVPPAEPPAL